MHDTPTTIKQTTTPRYYDDEISLTELIVIIWRWRYLATLTALAVIILGVIYLLIAQPVYKAKAEFLPPLARDIAGLNVSSELNLISYEPEAVFTQFSQNLASLTLRQKFFNEKELIKYYAPADSTVDAEQVFLEKFTPDLTVQLPKTNANTAIELSFEFEDPELAAAIVNDFAAQAMQTTVNQLTANVLQRVGSGITQLEGQIIGKRALAKQRREDQIIQLQEALNIARSLGINKPVDYLKNYQGSNKSDIVSVNTIEMPSYARGTETLQAEITSLKQRENDDAFIDGLRDLEEGLATLREISIDVDKIKVAIIDQAALTPIKPEKPNKKLILALTLLLAIIIGIGVTFLAEFIHHLRQTLPSNSATEKI